MEKKLHHLNSHGTASGAHGSPASALKEWEAWGRGGGDLIFHLGICVYTLKKYAGRRNLTISFRAYFHNLETT